MSDSQNTSQYKSLFATAEHLGELLLRHGWRVACAESCTGGGIARAFTEVPGSSDWFDLGLVTYSNAMKHAHLNVSVATLQQHGAVSEPVVREMAVGALQASGAQIAVSTSGVAGPGGGSEAKPVGTVCFAWGTRADIRVGTRHFTGDRKSVRSQSVLVALQNLIDFMESDSIKNTV